MASPGPPTINMIVTIFRSRLRPEHREEYERMSTRMNDLARKMPGFLSLKTFTSPDGERVSVVEFASEAAHEAWRLHPEHRAAQRLGRERFYSEYAVQVCRIERTRRKKPTNGSKTPRAPQRRARL